MSNLGTNYLVWDGDVHPLVLMDDLRYLLQSEDRDPVLPAVVHKGDGNMDTGYKIQYEGIRLRPGYHAICVPEDGVQSVLMDKMDIVQFIMSFEPAEEIHGQLSMYGRVTRGGWSWSEGKLLTQTAKVLKMVLEIVRKNQKRGQP